MNEIEIRLISGNYVAFDKGKNRKFTGVATAFFPNGKVMSEIKYSEGVTQEIREYYPLGSLRKKIEVKGNSIKHGCYVEYDTTGMVAVLGQYQDGLKNGLWYYCLNNVVICTGTFQLGKKYGIWRYFDEYGKLIQEVVHYTNGHPPKYSYNDSNQPDIAPVLPKSKCL